MSSQPKPRISQNKTEPSGNADTRLVIRPWELGPNRWSPWRILLYHACEFCRRHARTAFTGNVRTAKFC